MWVVSQQTEHYLPVGHRSWCGWSVNRQRQNTIYLLVIDLGGFAELVLAAADGSIRLLTARVGYRVIPGQHRVIPPVPVGLEAAAFPLQRQKNTCTKVNKFGWMHTGRDIGFFNNLYHTVYENSVFGGAPSNITHLYLSVYVHSCINLHHVWVCARLFCICVYTCFYHMPKLLVCWAPICICAFVHVCYNLDSTFCRVFCLFWFNVAFQHLRSYHDGAYL